MALPEHSPYVVIGAGIHGLSTARHLAEQLRARGRGGGEDIVVLDKSAPGAGATGIACGVVRNNYFQPAMRELMAHSVAAWEADAGAYGYHPVGYLQISCEGMRDDVAQIAEQQAAIGYPSTFIDGAGPSHRYLRGMLDDWRAAGITSVLHEHKGGYANAPVTVAGLERKARLAGVRIHTGVAVTGFGIDGGTIHTVETDAGAIRANYVVIAVGPWISPLWELLGLPRTIDVADGAGNVRHDVPMWSYLCLQEGTLGVEPDRQRTTTGDMPPVIHVDTDAPLVDDRDGTLITDQLWGIYYKPDYGVGGIQGGAMPRRVDVPAEQVRIDPYGPDSPEFVVGEDFARFWCAALAFCQSRFAGESHRYRREARSGGLGCFTPDSFPVFDTVHKNGYVIADSNHGFKMIGVGELVAGEILGTESELLRPFRFERFARGELHPVSHSPYPWS